MSKNAEQRQSSGRKKPTEPALDEALAETFPASDPVAPTNPVTSPKIDPKLLRKQAGEAWAQDEREKKVRHGGD